eukprot:SAG22_NODE_1353_length_4639_cov_4.851101_4_plen_229_part_00
MFLCLSLRFHCRSHRTVASSCPSPEPFLARIRPISPALARRLCAVPQHRQSPRGGAAPASTPASAAGLQPIGHMGGRQGFGGTLTTPPPQFRPARPTKPLPAEHADRLHYNSHAMNRRRKTVAPPPRQTDRIVHRPRRLAHHGDEGQRPACPPRKKRPPKVREPAALPSVLPTAYGCTGSLSLCVGFRFSAFPCGGPHCPRPDRERTDTCFNSACSTSRRTLWTGCTR